MLNAELFICKLAQYGVDCTCVAQAKFFVVLQCSSENKAENFFLAFGQKCQVLAVFQEGLGAGRAHVCLQLYLSLLSAL